MAHLEIEQLVLGDLDTNCYLLSCSQTSQVLIVDPADSADFITQKILDRQLTPVGILLTHGHFDHVLGLLELKLNFPVPVMMHEADVFLLEKAQASARHWLKREVDPVPPPTTFVKESDIVTIGQCHLKVIETPGHTPGSICAYDATFLVTGDTLFKDGVGATNHAYSSKKRLWKSLERIRPLAAERTSLPGHGESF